MWLKHYSLDAECSDCDWIKQYVKFHRTSERGALFEDGEVKIEAFLPRLAIQRHVASATQNQAMNALVFLYKCIDAIRSAKNRYIPVVLSQDEVKHVLAWLESAINIPWIPLRGIEITLAKPLISRRFRVVFDFPSLVGYSSAPLPIFQESI